MPASGLVAVERIDAAKTQRSRKRRVKLGGQRENAGGRAGRISQAVTLRINAGSRRKLRISASIDMRALYLSDGFVPAVRLFESPTAEGRGGGGGGGGLRHTRPFARIRVVQASRKTRSGRTRWTFENPFHGLSQWLFEWQNVIMSNGFGANNYV